MEQKTFLSYRWILRNFFLIFFIFFISIELFSLVILLSSLIIYSFRRKKINKFLIEKTDDSLLFSPITGRVSIKQHEDYQLISMRTSFLKGFDIIMPLNGEVSDYKEVVTPRKLWKLVLFKKVELDLHIKSLAVGEVKLRVTRTGVLFHPEIWLRIGDRAFLGSILGYLPFGGKLSLEIKNDMKVLLKNHDNAEALVTLIASMRND